jgi:prepilin-type N-terminal cleavage/methylation domain-containing protein
MKSRRCHYSGFTLVELLVVIAIIAILAAVLTVAAGSVINAAKRAKAANTANQIQTAITNYYTEYGVYPVSTAQGSGADVVEGKSGAIDTNEQLLFFALCGNINAYTPTTPTNNTGGVSNTRNIAFLTPKKSEVDQNGVPFNPFSTSAAPVYFSIAIDADYSGILGDTGGILGSMPDFVNWKSNTSMVTLANGLTQSAAVWTCCDPTNVKNFGNSKSPSLWVHTY